MDFFNGGGGYNFDLGATSSASGGKNEGGAFSVGAFNNGGIDSKWVIGGAVAMAVILLIAVVKK